jgi:hypothetical protein
LCYSKRFKKELVKQPPVASRLLLGEKTDLPLNFSSSSLRHFTSASSGEVRCRM